MGPLNVWSPGWGTLLLAAVGLIALAVGGGWLVWWLASHLAWAP